MRAPFVSILALSIFHSSLLAATDLVPSISNVTPNSLSAGWAGIEGNSYIAGISENEGFDPILFADVVNESFMTYNNLSPSTQYYFRVKISTEEDSEYRAVSAVTLPEEENLSRPSINNINRNPASFDLLIGAGGNSDGTGVQATYGNFDAENTVSGVFQGGQAALTLGGLESNKRYTVRARAVSADGSRFSDDDSSNVFTFPATPVSLSATEEGQNVRLNWSNNGNSQNDPQTNYQIQIANDPAFNDARVEETSNLTILINQLDRTLANYFRVRAEGDDDDDLSPYSETVTVAGTPPPDRTPPTVTLLSPANGSELSGTISISGTAGDNIALSRVEVSIDAGAFAQASGLSNWSYGINTLTLSNGTHAIAVRAVDTSSNTASMSITINVQNVVIPPPDTTPPNLSIGSPVNGSSVSASISISGTAADNVSLSRVEVSVDAGAFAQASGLSNWSYGINTLTLSNGTHAIAVRAVDTSSNTASSSITVNVQNQATPPPEPPPISATLDPGIRVLSQSVSGGILRQTLTTSVPAKVIYSNQVRLSLQPGSTVDVVAASNAFSVSLSPSSPQNVQVTHPVSNPLTLNVVLKPASGEIKTEIPPDAFSVDVALEFIASLGSQNLPQLEISPQTPVQPVKDISISMEYRPENLGGLDPNSLMIARFDEFLRIWVPASRNFERSNGKVTARINRLSLFQLMSAGGLSGAQAFPNPFRSHTAGHTAMTFRGLKSGGTVRVFTLLGELVRELQGNAAGETVWDAKNSSGEDVASGGYLALVQNDGGAETTLTIAVER